MTDATQQGLNENTMGALAYITFIPAIIFLAMPPYNQSPTVRFHSWQSIFLNAAAIAFWIAFTILRIMLGMVLPFGFGFLIFFISMACWVGWFILWLMCVINAVNGKRFMLPVIGALAAKQAGA